MRRPRPRTLVAIGLPVVLLAAFVGGWTWDTGQSSETSLRNVELAGEDVGGLTADEVAEAVALQAVAFSQREVRIDTGRGEPLESTAADLGLAIDQEATTQAVLDEGRGGTALLRPFAWLRSFVAPYEVEPRYAIRDDQLAVALSRLEGDEARRPVEPTLVASPDAVRVQGGEPGSALDPDTVADRLLDAARAGEDPITVSVDPETRDPQVTDAEAEELAAEAEELTAQPFTATVLDQTATFGVPEQRSWIGSAITSNGIELTWDEERITTVLHDAIGSLGQAEPEDARFTVEGGAVRLIPAVVGIRCCDDDAAAQIATAVEAGDDAVTVQPVEVQPELTTAEAEALGIREPVGTTTVWQGRPQVKSFTTYHPCCANRVTNIHRIADIVRGSLVLPGETFSVNGRVGRRTTENGFVVAGAIANGEHVEEVGGGVSQFATTMFNAVFFAGLPFGEYQAHSEHFDRYPFGREATMGYEHPDLQFTNDTPYGILIWTSYTDTSITVTLYSTQHAYGNQTGQTTSHSGGCTSVITERTITFPDGRTATDTVRARYRDPGVTRCG